MILSVLAVSGQLLFYLLYVYHSVPDMFSFGNFNNKEIADLIGNKDPIGLESYSQKSNLSSETTNNQQSNCKNNAIPSQDEAMWPDESNMAHDAIPHYLKSGNCNNSANSNKDKEEETTPTLQINSKSRPIRSISSGNLAKKISFKSFEDIQQSRKRSCTNSHKTLEIDGGNPSPSTNPNFSSNPLDSEAIIQQFNDKTKEITKTMANLCFSTIDLRNKISQGCITNINPIITQVTRSFQNQGQGQVRVDIYPPAQMCWREIRGFLHKEMNLRIKSAFYDAISTNEIYPAWTIAFQPPPNLMTNMYQIETVVSLCKTQAKDMLKTLSLMSSEEAKNCKERVDAATQAIKAYYQQPGASKYNLDEALNALLTLTERSQKLVHAEQQKRFLELSHKPTLALYSGCPENFLPENIKNQRLQPFQLPPPGEESIKTHPRGELNNIKRPRRPNQGPKAFVPRKGNQAQRIKKILELLNL